MISSLDKKTRRADSRQRQQRAGLACENGTSPFLETEYTLEQAEKPKEGAADVVEVPDVFRVTLDPVACSSKPSGRDMGTITRRMQAAGPTEVTYDQFIEQLRAGKTWCAGTFEPSASGWGAFLGQQVFAVDIDNGTHDHPLHEGDAGFLHPLDALDRCERLHIPPLCLYFTLSAVCTGDDATSVYRYRIVFAGKKPLNKGGAKAVSKTLLECFPEADLACKNPNRLWLGSCGEVWDVARTWGGAVPWLTFTTR